MFRILFAILMAAWCLPTAAQNSMQLFINGKEQSLDKPYHKVGANDSVVILIHISAGVNATNFLSSVQAKVCRTIQYQKQSQEQTVNDKSTIFEKISDALRKKTAHYVETVSNKSNEQMVRIVFTGSITQCIEKFFWVYLNVNPLYQQSLSGIENFKSKLRFKRKNEQV